MPRSADRSTRAFDDAPVPNQTCDVPSTATFDPLAANAPSPDNAGGSLSAGTRVQCSPPSSVLMITNAPLTESLTAMPCASSQNTIASKNASGSAFANLSAHVTPLSVVL